MRVRLKTSGVNPSHWKSRSGRAAAMLAPLIIPHSDGAGDLTGSALASPIALASESGFGTGNGVGHMARMPNISCCHRRKLCCCPNIGYAEGACFGIPALTALQAVRLAELNPASTVMILLAAAVQSRITPSNLRRCAARVSLPPSADLRRRHMLVAPAQTRSSIIEPKMSVSALRHHSF
jgi:NADPH2:quinone reductase